MSILSLSNEIYTNAVLAFNNGEDQTALNLLNQITTPGNLDPDILFVQACAMGILGRVDEALDYIIKVLIQNPNYPNAKNVFYQFLLGSKDNSAKMPTEECLLSVPNPLLPAYPAILESEISTMMIKQGYLYYGMDVASYFKELEKVQIYRCPETGYRFYYPFEIAGNDAFYQELESWPSYYPITKWEYTAAEKLISFASRVLEVGCGRGYFLAELIKKDCTVVGLEMNPNAVDFAREQGLDVRAELIQNHIKNRPGLYDYVCSFQVLEHITDVGNFLKDCIAALKPGGKLIIGVPNNDAVVWTYDLFQALNRPPHHMGLWTPESLIRITNYFPIRVSNLFFEPVHQDQLGWVKDIVLKAMACKLDNFNPALLDQLLTNQSLITSLVQCVLAKGPGNTILVEYTKL
jgi:SAM-dependent methyltransferase